jgi:hypothetical protein
MLHSCCFFYNNACHSCLLLLLTTTTTTTTTPFISFHFILYSLIYRVLDTVTFAVTITAVNNAPTIISLPIDTTAAITTPITTLSIADPDVDSSSSSSSSSSSGSGSSSVHVTVILSLKSTTGSIYFDTTTATTGTTTPANPTIATILNNVGISPSYGRSVNIRTWSLVGSIVNINALLKRLMINVDSDSGKYSCSCLVQLCANYVSIMLRFCCCCQGYLFPL